MYVKPAISHLVAAVSLAVAPMASAQSSIYSGAFSLYGGVSNPRADDPDEIDVKNPPVFGGSGRVNVPIGSGGLSAQFDLNADFAIVQDVDDIDQNFGSAVTIGTHISTRTSDYQVGGFFAFGTASAAEDEQVTLLIYGVEGLYNVTPQIQAYGQIGGFTTNGQGADPDGIQDAVFGRVIGRYFLSPNSLIEAEYNYGQGDVDPTTVDGASDDDVLQALAIRYERQITGQPVSWHVGYRRIEAEDKLGETDVTEDTVFAGVTFRFGAASIQEDLTRGASLSTPWAPGIWTGYAIEVLD